MQKFLNSQIPKASAGLELKNPGIKERAR